MRQAWVCWKAQGIKSVFVLPSQCGRRGTGASWRDGVSRGNTLFIPKVGSLSPPLAQWGLVGGGNDLGLGALSPAESRLLPKPRSVSQATSQPLTQGLSGFSCAGPGPEMFMGCGLCVCSVVSNSLQPHGP